VSSPEISEIRAPAVGEICVWTLTLDAPSPAARRSQANGALKRVLGSCLDVAPELVRFGELPGGKPTLAGRELEFNLTHSGTWAMIAVSREVPVGIDLERPRRFASAARFERLAQRICSPEEQAAVAAAPNPEAFLLRLWVRKEAVVKAEGTGVGAGERLPELDVLAGRTGDYCVADLAAPQAGYHAALSQAAPHALTIAQLPMFTAVRA
jgi:phosphopantetheine--protein transferase-like protein